MISKDIIIDVLGKLADDPTRKPSEFGYDINTFYQALKIINDENYATGIRFQYDGAGKVYVALHNNALITMNGLTFLEGHGKMKNYDSLKEDLGQSKGIQNVKYTIFISSTYSDLKEERAALTNSLLSKNFIPVGMELFHAVPADQWTVITKMLEECDYYLLIIGGRYGSIDPEAGISYTEKEYNYAREQGIPVIAFLPKNPENIVAGKMDSCQDQLSSFKEKIKNGGNTVAFYEGIENLKVEVLSSLDNLLTFAPRPGWVRTSELYKTQQKAHGLEWH